MQTLLTEKFFIESLFSGELYNQVVSPNILLSNCQKSSTGRSEERIYGVFIWIEERDRNISFHTDKVWVWVFVTEC